MLNQRFSKTVELHISRLIPAMLTISIFFRPVFYGLSDGGIHFSILFSGIFLFGQTFGTKENEEFYKILHIYSAKSRHTST